MVPIGTVDLSHTKLLRLFVGAFTSSVFVLAIIEALSEKLL